MITFNNEKYNKSFIVAFLLIISTLILVGSLQTDFAAKDIAILDNGTGISEGIKATNNDGIIALDKGLYNKETDRNITISKNLTIRGNGPTGTVIIDAQRKSRIFTIAPNTNVIFINITFINGNYQNGGAIVNEYSNSKFTIDTCSFKNSGSVIYNKGNNCVVMNSHFDDGGSINNNADNFIVMNCSFKNNNANYGGVIYNHGGNKFNVWDSAFTENTADFCGGVIYNTESTDFTVSSSNFTHNKAIDGGVLYHNGDRFTVSRSNFIENSATHGAVFYDYYKKSLIKVSSSKFTHNKGEHGYEVYYSPDKVAVFLWNFLYHFINSMNKKK